MKFSLGDSMKFSRPFNRKFKIFKKLCINPQGTESVNKEVGEHRFFYFQCYIISSRVDFLD